MLDFMEYILRSFAEQTSWNRDNSYSALTDTSRALLEFSTPERLRVHLSSLSTPHFATTYTLGTVGLIDGSVSYLFSTVPLDGTPSQSNSIPLRRLVPGYRRIYAPAFSSHAPAGIDTSKDDPKSQRQKPTLLHATLHLPPPTTINALFMRRLSPSTQLSVALFSSQQAQSPFTSAPQASILTQISRDTGKYNTEFLFSTDNALIGLRGLWNFGPDPRKTDLSSTSNGLKSHPAPLISAGGEFYYSPLSSVIGLSTGVRFTTLPVANGSTSTPPPTGFQAASGIPASPYTLTLTLTPLTGSLSTTYSILASPDLAFSSRFGFNVYSWESEMVAGCELWRRKRSPASKPPDGLEWARRKMGLPLTPLALSTEDGSSPESPFPGAADDSGSSDSVIKVRVDSAWNIRLLWEGRVKDLLVSAGVGLGPAKRSASYGSGSLASAGGDVAAGRSGYGWTGVGVSVLYSS